MEAENLRTKMPQTDMPMPFISVPSVRSVLTISP